MQYFAYKPPGCNILATLASGINILRGLGGRGSPASLLAGVPGVPRAQCHPLPACPICLEIVHTRGRFVAERPVKPIDRCQDATFPCQWSGKIFLEGRPGTGSASERPDRF